MSNPLYALGPLGELAGPTSAAAGAILGRLGQGARQVAGGKLPRFVTEEAGKGRADLGLGNVPKPTKVTKQADVPLGERPGFGEPPPQRQGEGYTTLGGGDIRFRQATRAIQEEGPEYLALLEPFSTKGPYGPKLDPRSHGGLVGQQGRALAAGDEAVVQFLGEANARARLQDFVKGLAQREAKRQGISFPDRVAAFAFGHTRTVREAADAVPDAARAAVRAEVAEGALSPATAGAVQESATMALRERGIAPTAEAVEAVTDQVIANARNTNRLTAAHGRQVSAHEQAVADATVRARNTPPPATPEAPRQLVERIRSADPRRTDAQIVDQLVDHGMSRKDARMAVAKAIPPEAVRAPYPGEVPPGGPDMAAVRASRVTPPGNPATVQATTLFDPLSGMRPNPNLPPPPPVPPAPPPVARGGGGGFDFGGVVNELINFPRSILATGEVSQLLRQGLIPIVSAAISRSPARREIARDAFVNAFRGYSDRFAGEAWGKVMSDPLFSKWKATGGFEAEIPAQSLKWAQKATGKEEMFLSDFAKRLWGVRTITTAAERSYALTLNALRFQTWKEAYEGARAGGKLLTQAEQDALAKWINVASGRGSLGKLEQASNVLNGILFAPRFAISRVEAPILAARLFANPATRRVGVTALQDIAKVTSAGIGIMKLAELAGLRVGWDPTSTDFGKIRVGNTAFDIWGGFGQPAVLLARIAFDQVTNSRGKASALSGDEFGQTNIAELLGRYFRSKTSPLPGTLWSLAEGKTYVGEPFGPRGGQNAGETAASLIAEMGVPMSYSAAVEAVVADLTKGTSQELGLPPGTIGVAAGALGMFGVGVGTYERPKVRDPLGRLDEGNLPVHPVLEEWEKVRQGSAKDEGGRPTFSGLGLPTRDLGKVVLADAELDRLQQLVGQSREQMLGQVVASPMFQAGGQADREKLLAGVRAKADEQGRVAFGVEHAVQAKDDLQRVRGVSVALGAVGRDRGARMKLLTDLNTAGVLTQTVKDAVDDLRTVRNPLADGYEPTVNQHLGGQALQDRYLAAPAFRFGTPEDWRGAMAQAQRLSRTYRSLQREASQRSVRIQQLDQYDQYMRDYTEARVGAFRAVQFLETDGSIRTTALSPERLALRNDPLWSLFDSAIRRRDPYSPKS